MIGDNLTRAQQAKLAKIAAEFQKSMNQLDKCPKCKKSRMVVSMGFGDGKMNQITSQKCECK